MDITSECFSMGTVGLRLLEFVVYNGKDEIDNESYFHVDGSDNSFREILLSMVCVHSSVFGCFPDFL